jgi:hypothetical protein
VAVLIQTCREGGELGGKGRESKKLVTGHNICFTIQTHKKLRDQAQPE